MFLFGPFVVESFFKVAAFSWCRVSVFSPIPVILIWSESLLMTLIVSCRFSFTESCTGVVAEHSTGDNCVQTTRLIRPRARPMDEGCLRCLLPRRFLVATGFDLAWWRSVDVDGNVDRFVSAIFFGRFLVLVFDEHHGDVVFAPFHWPWPIKDPAFCASGSSFKHQAI